MHTKLGTCFAIALGIFVCAGTTMGQSVEWMNQEGTSATEWSYDICTDAQGNIYITGFTMGDLAATNAGDKDAYVSKYSPAGQLLWSRQFGSAGYDTGGGDGVFVDAAGNVYVAGHAGGRLPGSSTTGGAFLSRYDSDGNLAWVTQYGSNSTWSGGVIADDAGNIYTSGYVAGQGGVFLNRFDSNGTLVWSRERYVGRDSSSQNIAMDDAGNVYFSGVYDPPTSSIIMDDGFIAVYDPAGTMIWDTAFGTDGYERIHGLAVDGAGNTYVAGSTNGALHGASAGLYDIFVRMYDSTGQLVWAEQVGTQEHERCFDLAVDEEGNIFLSGYTEGDLDGTNAGGEDGFVIKFDSQGRQVWEAQLGTSDDETIFGLTADGVGGVYFTGHTTGDMVGPNAGGYDIIVGQIPEPTTLSLLALGALAALRRRHL